MPDEQRSGPISLTCEYAKVIPPARIEGLCLIHQKVEYHQIEFPLKVIFVYYLLFSLDQLGFEKVGVHVVVRCLIHLEAFWYGEFSWLLRVLEMKAKRVLQEL